MRLRELTYILTEECNFRCAYCPQVRGKRRLEEAAAAGTVRLFRRFLEKGAAVCFYGGEPLLAFPVLRSIVERLERGLRSDRQRIHFVLTTNGSLMTPEILRFLERHRFSLILSFDGLAQDVSRRPGSYTQMVALVQDILMRSALRLAVNSVFTPRTVGLLGSSVEEMISLGIGTIHLLLPAKPAWTSRSLAKLENELAALRPANISFFRAHGEIPVSQLRWRGVSRGLFSCFAGRDRLAIAPDGTVWGCYQIYDYSRLAKDGASEPYQLDDVTSLLANPHRLERRLSGFVRGLDQTDLSTSRSPCLFCPDLEECAICPWVASLESGTFRLVSEDACRIMRLLGKERRALQEACENLSRSSRQVDGGPLRSPAIRDPHPSIARGIFDRTLAQS